VRRYAITHPQLILEAKAVGLPDRDLIRLDQAHELACRLLDGLYRAHGVPFLCHAVRTASIVMAESRSIDAVLAAMLHAVYFLHYFDRSCRRGPRRSDRVFLRERIGVAAERLVDRYAGFPWGTPDIVRGYLEAIDEQSDDARELILMKLANELDDHLDAAPAFVTREGATVHDPSYGAEYVALAAALGRDALASDLREAFDLCRRVDLPPELARAHGGSYELRSRLWKANPVERIGGALRRRRRR